MEERIKITDGIKVSNQLILNREIFLDYLSRPNVITKVFQEMEGGGRRASVGGRHAEKTWPVSADFGEGGRSHKPRKVDSLEAGEGDKSDSCLEPPEGGSLLAP